VQRASVVEAARPVLSEDGAGDGAAEISNKVPVSSELFGLRPTSLLPLLVFTPLVCQLPANHRLTALLRSTTSAPNSPRPPVVHFFGSR